MHPPDSISFHDLRALARPPESLFARSVTAVYINDLTRNVGRGVRAQKYHRAAKIFQATKTPHGNPLQHALPPGLVR